MPKTPFPPGPNRAEIRAEMKRQKEAFTAIIAQLQADKHVMAGHIAERDQTINALVAKVSTQEHHSANLSATVAEKRVRAVLACTCSGTGGCQLRSCTPLGPRWSSRECEEAPRRWVGRERRKPRRRRPHALRQSVIFHRFLIDASSGFQWFCRLVGSPAMPHIVGYGRTRPTHA